MEFDAMSTRIPALHPREWMQPVSDETCEKVVRMVAESCGTNQISLYLISSDGTELTLRTAVGLPPSWHTRAGRLPLSLFGSDDTTWGPPSLSRAVIAVDFSEPVWGPLAAEARDAGLGTAWGLPLIVRGDRLVGMLVAYYPRSSMPGCHQVEMMRTVAREVASCIDAACSRRTAPALPSVRVALPFDRLFVRLPSPEAAFSEMADMVKSHLGADVVLLQHIRADGRVLFFQSEPLFSVAPLHWADSVSREALRSGHIVRRTGVDLSGTVFAREPVRFARLVCYPMALANGHLTVSIGWYRPRPLTARDEKVVAAYTQFTALEMENFLLRHEGRSPDYSFIRGLLLALRTREPGIVAHSRRVVTYALLLAERLGLHPDLFEPLAVGALCHDVGKIGIADTILTKPGRLTAAEFAAVKQHPIIGYDMLESSFSLLPAALHVIRHHHERVDGRGYPDGLAGDAIPLPARIVSVADAFDAMTGERPYRSRRSISEARGELSAHRGTQFCPACVDAFLSISPSDLRAIHRGELDRSPFPGFSDDNGLMQKEAGTG